MGEIAFVGREETRLRLLVVGSPVWISTVRAGREGASKRVCGKERVDRLRHRIRIRGLESD